MRYATEKGLAMCGLACVLCSDADCPGCKAMGRENAGGCGVYQCAAEKGLDGCYQCGDFTCGQDMLQGTRNRAFNRYARRHGKDALLERLRVNAGHGIAYHRPDGQPGDYDTLAGEEDVLRLLHYGSDDPYRRCPVLETERFLLRHVRMEDAGDLLACYADPKAQAIFNADCCTSDFRYRTHEEMEACLRFFLQSYAVHGFVRFAIVDKATARAVGTLEMFGNQEPFDAYASWGIMRLDIASPYETADALGELLGCATASLYGLFDVQCMLVKAIPQATERIAALSASGFAPYEWTEPGRDHYWLRARS